MDTLTILKLDAVKQQLETIIRLYFFHTNSLSIHTLTAATHNIVRDINKHLGGEPLQLTNYRNALNNAI